MILIRCLAVISVFITSSVYGAESEAVNAPSDVINLSCDKPLRISNLHVNREEVVIYNKFEITFDLDGRWDNPFDPKQVKVDGYFTSPSGAVIVAPGFYYQEYQRTMISGVDSYKPIGDPVWKVRFAPGEPGEYAYSIKVVNGEHSLSTDKAACVCSIHTANHGFVKISETNPLYFEYQDGTPFFALATCKWWDNLADIETHYAEFARAGGNMTRNFQMRIGELVDPPTPRPDRGFGKIDLDRAWRHDQALEQCEQLGICQQISITNGTCFMPWDQKRWNMSVYNKKHGGPLSDRAGQGRYFLTELAARENFKLELRYFVARWAYSTAVFSWNLWNEIDLMPKYDSLRKEAQQWHREMGQYLEEIDWAEHIVHTNFKTVNGDPMLDSLPEMDMVSVNTYTQKDFTPSAELWIKRHLAAYNKPVMFSEFGIGHSYKPEEGYTSHDPERIMAHNGMWSAAMSGSAGTGMVFGWNWITNKKYYTYLNALANFLDRVPFSQRMWKPINIESFHFSNSAQKPYFADVYVEGWYMNYRFPNGWKNHEVFEIEADGQIKNREFMSGHLGPPLGRKRVVLDMEYPEKGEFTVFVPEIFLRKDNPGPPQLNVSLDNQIVVQQKFDVDPKNARHLYQRYSFPVPKGKHAITIENSGGGFMPVGYELGGFVRRDGPDLQVRGMQTHDMILIWLKSPKLTWLYSRTGIKAPEQHDGELVLTNIPDCQWTAEWLDTIDNKWIRRSVEKSTNGKLILKTPTIQQSAAVRLFKVGDLP